MDKPEQAPQPAGHPHHGAEPNDPAPASRRPAGVVRTATASAVAASLVAAGVTVGIYQLSSDNGSTGAATSNSEQSLGAATPGGTGSGRSMSGVAGGLSNGAGVPPGSAGGLAPGGGVPGSAQLGTASTDTTDATDKQEKGVVDIYTTLSDGSDAAGTGMILTANGKVLTNNHVVEDSVSIKVVVVSTQKTYVARALGTDATDDVAVLKLVHASGLRTVTIDTAGAARTGDAVTAVGNAGGNGGLSTAAAGTVTATHRNITVRSETDGARTRLTNLIKVDADIQSGDSGGPLYDQNNDIVGMNTAASIGTAKVTGFAIPIATAEAVVSDIAKGRNAGDISLGYPAFLGVELRSASAGVAGGASIAGVVTGTGAAEAGLQAGDRITAVDGHAIANARQLSRAIRQYEPGKAVSVTWVDSRGNTSTASVTLKRGPLI